jgi:hypothetical protein
VYACISACTCACACSFLCVRVLGPDSVSACVRVRACTSVCSRALCARASLCLFVVACVCVRALSSANVFA